MVIWIGNKTGAVESRITFEGMWAPFPVPTPVNEDMVSEHQMLGSNAAPGLLVVQDFGPDSGTLAFRWKSLPPELRNPLRELYELWEAGERPPVQVHIDGVTRVCAWRRFRDPRRPRRIERYAVEADFRILEVLS